MGIYTNKSSSHAISFDVYTFNVQATTTIASSSALRSHLVSNVLSETPSIEDLPTIKSTGVVLSLSTPANDVITISPSDVASTSASVVKRTSSSFSVPAETRSTHISSHTTNSLLSFSAPTATRPTESRPTSLLTSRTPDPEPQPSSVDLRSVDELTRETHTVDFTRYPSTSLPTTPTPNKSSSHTQTSTLKPGTTNTLVSNNKPDDRLDVLAALIALPLFLAAAVAIGIWWWWRKRRIRRRCASALQVKWISKIPPLSDNSFDVRDRRFEPGHQNVVPEPMENACAELYGSDA